MQMQSSSQNEAQLINMVSSADWLMAALEAVQALHLPSWCIGAGAIRNLVWDRLHGYASPTSLSDIDVVYFDSDAPIERDAELQRFLNAGNLSLPWEVTNQAHVHHWYHQYGGIPVRPLISLQDAIASWPEYATAVGVYLDENHRLRVIAPFGLDDLFAMRVRHNPARISQADYLARIRQKQFTQRWPRVVVTP